VLDIIFQMFKVKNKITLVLLNSLVPSCFSTISEKCFFLSEYKEWSGALTQQSEYFQWIRTLLPLLPALCIVKLSTWKGFFPQRTETEKKCNHFIQNSCPQKVYFCTSWNYYWIFSLLLVIPVGWRIFCQFLVITRKTFVKRFVRCRNVLSSQAVNWQIFSTHLLKSIHTWGVGGGGIQLFKPLYTLFLLPVVSWWYYCPWCGSVLKDFVFILTFFPYCGLKLQNKALRISSLSSFYFILV